MAVPLRPPLLQEAAITPRDTTAEHSHKLAGSPRLSHVAVSHSTFTCLHSLPIAARGKVLLHPHRAGTQRFGTAETARVMKPKFYHFTHF